MLREIKGGAGDLFHMSAPLTPVAPRSSDVSLEDALMSTGGDFCPVVVVVVFCVFWWVRQARILLFYITRKCQMV